MARLTAARGYWLTALETYSATCHEGRATFVGPLGEIGVEKKGGQWSIHGNRRDLAVRDLDRRFGEEREFLDTLSGYVLSNVHPG